MCGRFYIDDKMINEMEKIFAKMDEKSAGSHAMDRNHSPIKGEVFPSGISYVIRQDNYNKASVTTGIFGYQNQYDKGLLINAKSETVMEKPTFKYDFEKRRCVIPAAGYFEWYHKKDTNSVKNKAEKYFFYGNSGIVYLAGIYHDDRFVILTTTADENVRQIHERMPLILSKEEVDEYLFSYDIARQYLLKKSFIENIERCV